MLSKDHFIYCLFAGLFLVLLPLMLQQAFSFFLLFCLIPLPSIPSVLFPLVTLFQTELLLNLTTLQLHPFWFVSCHDPWSHFLSSPLLFPPLCPSLPHLAFHNHFWTQSPRLSWTWTSPCATRIGASHSAWQGTPNLSSYGTTRANHWRSRTTSRHRSMSRQRASTMAVCSLISPRTSTTVSTRWWPPTSTARTRRMSLLTSWLSPMWITQGQVGAPSCRN